MFLKYLACLNARLINIFILVPQENNETNEEVDAEKKGTKSASYEHHGCLEIMRSEQESKKIVSLVVPIFVPH